MDGVAESKAVDVRKMINNGIGLKRNRQASLMPAMTARLGASVDREEDKQEDDDDDDVPYGAQLLDQMAGAGAGAPRRKSSIGMGNSALSSGRSIKAILGARLQDKIRKNSIA